MGTSKAVASPAWRTERQYFGACERLSFATFCRFALGGRYVTLCFAVPQRLFRRGQNPVSECLDCGIAQTIPADDELVIVHPQFGGGQRANETAGGNIRFNQRERSQRDAKAIDGGLNLKIGVIQFDVPNRHERGDGCERQPLRPCRSRRRGMQQDVPAEILRGFHGAISQYAGTAYRKTPVRHQGLALNVHAALDARAYADVESGPDIAELARCR
jgi:hypothetical protein